VKEEEAYKQTSDGERRKRRVPNRLVEPAGANARSPSKPIIAAFGLFGGTTAGHATSAVIFTSFFRMGHFLPDRKISITGIIKKSQKFFSIYFN
jgi:hypothetical protein